MGEGTSPADPLIGQVVERCRILSRIGRGGMGLVYLAEHTALKRRVTLKVLPPETARDREYVARFRREAIAAARLEHPNIVQVYDVGEHEGMPFMVRQYVEGMTLAEILEGSKRIEPKEAARVAREVARGLAAAHAQGIIHRDIKPENILVSENGDVRITDFGIALDPETPGTAPAGGVLVGTPYYLSPEQAEGKKTDARSDLYSLGVTLYATVTGRVPFSGPNVAAVLYKHVHEAPRRPSAVARDVPPYLDDLILKLMAKKPEHRYASAEEAERDLDRFVRGAFSRGRREAAGAPAPRPALPRAVIIAAAAGAAAVLVLLGVLLAGRGKPEVPPPPGPDVTATAPPRTAETALQKEERAFREVEEASRAGRGDLRPKAEAFLRDFPSGRHAEEVRRMLAPPAPAPPDETGFAVLYRSKTDESHWAHSRGLERMVFFLKDSILVSFPTASVDANEKECLLINQHDLMDFILRFEIRAGGTFPSLLAGNLSRGMLALPGRTRPTLLRIPDLPPQQWHALELEAREGRLRLTSGTRVLAEGVLEEEGSPFGSAGFDCRPGSDFEVRNVQIRVLRRVDLSRIAREQPPPPDPDPAPPGPPAEGMSKEESEIVRKINGAAADEIPALALQLRDLAFSGQSKEVFDGKSLEGWRIMGPGASEFVRPRDDRIEIEISGKSAFLEHNEFPTARGLSFEIRVRKFQNPHGGGLALHRREPTRFLTLVIAPGEAALRERDGARSKILARRELPETLDHWFRIDMLAADGQTYLFLENEFLWRGPSVDPDSLGPVALMAGDMDCDFRWIRVFLRK